MSTLVTERDIFAESMCFSEDSLTVRLDDGRTLSIPLAWYPRLLNGTKAERENYELIDDGETGLLYEVGDIDGMADGALALLRDPARLNEMREAGRRTAQKRFCASLVVPQYVRYYEQVLGQQG